MTTVSETTPALPATLYIGYWTAIHNDQYLEDEIYGYHLKLSSKGYNIGHTLQINFSLGLRLLKKRQGFSAHDDKILTALWRAIGRYLRRHITRDLAYRQSESLIRPLIVRATCADLPSLEEWESLCDGCRRANDYLRTIRNYIEDQGRIDTQPGDVQRLYANVLSDLSFIHSFDGVCTTYKFHLSRREKNLAGTFADRSCSGSLMPAFWGGWGKLSGDAQAAWQQFIVYFVDELVACDPYRRPALVAA